MDCPPVTWSIDTTGLEHSGRASAAARRALAEWTAASGIRFDWVPTGGTISITFRTVDSRWLAYALADTIVIDPRIEHQWPHLLQRTIAHEAAHVLGIGHVAASNSIVSDTGHLGAEHVTPADAALIRRCPG